MPTSSVSSPGFISEARAHLRGADPVLAGVIDMVPATFDIKPSRNRYGALVNAIITQQLSGHSARAISGRFTAMYDAPHPRPADVIATPDSRLRETGLSVRKAETIKEVSVMIEDGRLRLERTGRMTDDQIKDTLTEVKGIGRWTAEMFMIFGLGRADVLPVGDLGLRKGVMRFYRLRGMPSEDRVEEIAEAWRPYRTVATWYIWKAQ